VGLKTVSEATTPFGQLNYQILLVGVVAVVLIAGSIGFRTLTKYRCSSR
jgi:hypothetical protein